MLYSRLRKLLQAEKLFRPRDRVLVCLSGGPDSVFLLHFLHKIKKDYALEIFVAHLNHGLRGKSSDADEAFSAELASVLGMPFFRAYVNVRALAAADKLCLEEAARKARYNFFYNLCMVQDIKKIVLAHTRDDQAETLLMRILRGTGIAGLGGMRLQCRFKDRILVRPLLTTAKIEILAYLKKHKLKFRLDESNLCPDFLRNKLRLELIPELEKINPRFADNILRLGQQAAQTDDFLRSRATLLFRRIVKTAGKNFALQRSLWEKNHPVLRQILIRQIIERLSGELSGLEFKHVQLADDFIGQGAPGKHICLSKKINIRLNRKTATFSIDENYSKLKEADCPCRLELKAPVVFGGYEFSCDLVGPDTDFKNHAVNVEYFDFEKIKFPLVLRRRRPGDWFAPLGCGRRKLKKFLTDMKIEDKDNIPLVVSEQEIIWVCGLRIGDKFKITENTKHILKIQCRKIVNSKS